MDLIDLSLERLERRRRAQHAFDALGPTVAASLLVAATVAIVIRLALPQLGPLVLPLAAFALLIPLVRLPRALRGRRAPALIAGELDLIVGGHGLAMALAAYPAAGRDAGWCARLRRPLEQLRVPPFAWHGGRNALAAAGCLLIALAVPQSERVPGFAVTGLPMLAPIEHRLEALADGGMLPEERAAEFRERLAALKQHVGQDGLDQQGWEAVDRLDRDLASSGAQAARRLADALTQAERQAAPDPHRDGAAVDAELARLAQAVADLAIQAPGLVPRFPAGADAQAMAAMLAKAAAQGKLSEAQLNALRALGLRAAGEPGAALDAKAMQALAQHLAEELAKNVGKCRGAGCGDAFGLALGDLQNQPGGGAPTRGPGHAALDRDERERMAGGSVVGLPPGARLNADGSVTLAEQARDADLDDAATQDALRAAARDFDPAAADARRATTAPRHRSAVGRYFASESTP